VDKPWLKSYPEGVPAELPEPPYKSVLDMINDCLHKFADRPAYSCMGTTYSHRDLDQKSRDFAAYLQKNLGLMKGQRVAIMLPNVLQYPVALFGIFRAGLVAVNVNPLYTARELKHQLKDSGACAIVILDNFASVLEEVIAETDVKHVVTTQVGDFLSFPKSAIVNVVLKYVKRAVPAYKLPTAISLTDALRAGSGQDLAPMQLGYADIAFLQYTGGTTGVSKGAIKSQRNMVYNVHHAQARQGAVIDKIYNLVAKTELPL